MLWRSQKACSLCLVCSVVFFIETVGYIYIGARLHALNLEWTLKTLPLKCLCSYSEIGREARAFFSTASSRNRAICGRVIGDR